MGDNFDLGHVDHVPNPMVYKAPSKGYAVSGKIMLSAIVILFTVVVFMICLHIYARWYLRRARRQQTLRRSQRRRTHIVFYVDPNSPAVAANRGIDPSVLETLPVFAYSKTHPETLECAVCLSEFEENEMGRLLPRCNHSFHTDCIDMWFHSHSTCPICRSPVEPAHISDQNPPDSFVSMMTMGQPGVSEPGSSSTCDCHCQQHDDEQNVPSSSSSSSSLGDRRKGLDMVRVTVEVPPRRYESEDELRPSSPASHGYRSPGSRLLSLKRILSLNRRASSSAVSPSSGVGTSCAELDIEQGRGESTQQTRARTPRS